MKILLIISSIILILSSFSFIDTNAITPGMHTIIAKPDCNKCHKDIQPLLSQPHNEIGCLGCHPKDNQTHVAKINQCSNCHFPNPKDIHQTTYPNCKECHLSHGKLKFETHNNATFMQIYPGKGCHNIHV